MKQAIANDHGQTKIAEAALRNLHLDCFLAADGERHFTSRVLGLAEGGLAIDAPVHRGRPVELTPGECVVCSCRLGREILRFTAVVADATRAPTGQVGSPTVRLAEIGELTTVQRRRHYRMSLDGRQPVDVTCWLVELAESGEAGVCSMFAAQMADVSPGGACVIIRGDQLLNDLDGRQVWVRFMLPEQKNESLIFRVEPRHVQATDDGSGWRIGVEFMEYIEPGQHQLIVDKLARFVMLRQQT